MNSKNDPSGKKKPKKNLAEIYGESKEQTNTATKEKNTKKNNVETEGEITKEKIYLVYILHRVVYETLLLCKKADPNEAIGVLLGYKYQYEDQKYVKVVDWVTGKAYQSHAFAEFTPDGVRQYTSIIEEKYGDSENRPKIVGIFHSHPFGSNPHFSATDYNTFLNFPYDTENNVFVLIDPRSNYYKSYIVVIDEKGMKDLREVDWVEYNPK